MTNRYQLLLESIQATDVFIMQMFGYSVIALAAYATLDWLPDWLKRPMQYLYLALALATFIFVTVYFWEW